MSDKSIDILIEKCILEYILMITNQIPEPGIQQQQDGQ